MRLGDKSSTNSLGVGSVRLISNVGNRKLVLTLKKVIYAPGIRRNLISVGAATNEGCSASFTGGHVQFRGSKNSLLLIGSRVGRLYVANVESANCREISSLNTEDVATDAPDKDDETGTKDSNMKLWHERLAHLNLTTISKMIKKNSATGMENVKIDKYGKSSDRKTTNCESCVLAKHARIPIPNSQRPRATPFGHLRPRGGRYN